MSILSNSHSVLHSLFNEEFFRNAAIECLFIFETHPKFSRPPNTEIIGEIVDLQTIIHKWLMHKPEKSINFIVDNYCKSNLNVILIVNMFCTF